jgi:hypothetical protein
VSYFPLRLILFFVSLSSISLLVRLGFADAEEDATLDGGWLLKATTNERVAAPSVYAHGAV